MSLSKALITGIIFGLTAGISPGPLLTLVITQTLKYGKKEGIKVALVPLITDALIVLFSVFILAKFSRVNMLFGIISLIGALFLAYLSYESITFQHFSIHSAETKPLSFKKGIITNILSPHPYIFWLTVGGPILVGSLQKSLFAGVVFVVGFYACLVGSKCAAALLTEKSRAFLISKTYLYIIRILGIVLLYFAAVFIRDGVNFLLE